ncbi:helix-turn-helix domain-containing protein [Hoeflea alexandrii]|uniref:helix-turn-helix domain-containing protein n=1 Tax=Hoeflea alexandrii TaxID=288436 RepID=UPI002271A743|nr:helix-turn-helix domain-containing protein [Hoeflea alexandrii]MCY0150928.1 helix-turn-helix domain-containing protein [Hoeflea alexandrii]
MTDLFPAEIDEVIWDEACRRADAIRGFLKRNPEGATAGDVAELAAELGLSRATAYRLIKLFRSGGTVLSLVDRKRGRPEGHRALGEKREEIIRATISAYYMKQTRPTVSQLVRDVRTNCMSAGLKPPHRRTVVARLRDIDLQKRAKRRGEQKIVKATTPVPGGSVHHAPWKSSRWTIRRPTSSSSTRRPASRSVDRG